MEKINGLAKDEVFFLYQLLFEVEAIKKEKLKFKRTYLKTIRKKSKLAINRKEKAGEISHQSELNRIDFYEDKSGTILCLLKHVRNAFAHGDIKNEGNYYHLEDYNNKRNQLTMCANIEMNLVKPFIEFLISKKITNQQ